MLPYSPNASLSDLSANGLLDDKFPSPHFYVRQPHCVQIIQLVEADAPPPPKVSSVIDSHSWASSSYYSSEYSESATSEDDADEEDEACTSYCSSDASPEELEASPSEHSKSSAAESSDTYSLRIKRILAWREDFYSQAQSAISEPSSPSLKRKLELDGDEDDNASHSSKRSRRSQASSVDSEDSLIMMVDAAPIGITSHPSSSLCMHSCPACDSFFDTPQSLRQHGLDAQANEACCVAVQYAFE
ncbi:hypothetical protein H1R20_g9625, partial [Candolleomyces eurysporus]